MCHNMYKVLPTKEAHLSLGFQDFYWGVNQVKQSTSREKMVTGEYILTSINQTNRYSVAQKPQACVIVFFLFLFFFKFLYHLGYYRVLSRVPCAIQ